MNNNTADHVKRLLGCLAFGFVLALMVGAQEGTQTDYGYAFRQAVFAPRIVIFLFIGVLAYLAITFWPRITPYFGRPGVRPFAAGALTVVASLVLLKWTDSNQLGTGKFSDLAKAVVDTHGISGFARLFFGSAVPFTGWLLLLVVVALAGTGILLRRPGPAYAGGALAILIGFWGFTAQSTVRSFLGAPDHSTGAAVMMLGYFAIAASAITSARSESETADSASFIDRVFSWRPGMPLVVLGGVVGLVAYFPAAWFSPINRNATIRTTSGMFAGTGLDPIAVQYLAWIGYVVFFAALALVGAAAYLRHRNLGWAAVALGVAGTVLTLYVLHQFSALAATKGFDGATGPWQNLGTGGWLAAAALTLLAGAGYLVATRGAKEPATEVSSDALGIPAGRADFNKALMLVVIVAALFLPPTATNFWQTVLVTEIGIYVLLAIGLNVVVGWAGLLDLGFIAFYAIGSYTTAYLTNTLPIHPPSWLHLTPLLAIPFAIVICLLAGLALGFPTLRLRGDYLAIVTLGFGEIIRITAINAGAVTNGPQGAFGIPAPAVHLGPVHITWGQSALQFWYLLLVLVAVTVLLFHRLENSRLGRAWAAIREDEVAAQATGINTTRVKLLAFAIGASTSGVAGVFFASQIGYINPDNFLLNNSILVVAYVVFGGMGSLPGAMAGAAVLTWLPEFLKDQVPAGDRQMWIGAIILVMMIFRPAGL
ncbi:MAG: branched-chain amino acid ABC transporter permease, partial [Actinomycetota bacterium]|nr:branched-chain amino acid ABC transporter permease [Actinomycetota bacterium]